VCSLAEQCREVDAFSLWRHGSPFVFLNTQKTPEHSRFDVAHELGHLVLHRHGHGGCDGAPDLPVEPCRLHGLDPFLYLDEVMRVLPCWPDERYLELAPKQWLSTRARLNADELDMPLSGFQIPPLLASSPATNAPP